MTSHWEREPQLLHLASAIRLPGGGEALALRLVGDEEEERDMVSKVPKVRLKRPNRQFFDHHRNLLLIQDQRSKTVDCALHANDDERSCAKENQRGSN